MYCFFNIIEEGFYVYVNYPSTSVTPCTQYNANKHYIPFKVTKNVSTYY